MLFKYQAIDQAGAPLVGTVTAISEEVAVATLQRRGLTLTSLQEQKEGGWQMPFFGRVALRDVVFLSRQIATLFEAQVSALRVFRLLAEQAEKPQLASALTQISDDLQGGSSISTALGKHPKIFSAFYVNMVRAGEESGKLDQTFLFLADYLDRSYELTSKARNALIYPAFVMATFVIVMLLMLTVIIPKIGGVLTDAGQDIPIYTKIVLGMSSFLIDYGIFILVFLIVVGFFFVRWGRTESGRLTLDRFKLGLPYIGDLYKKLYLARLADNMNVMLAAGISAVRALEITSTVVDNREYETILTEAVGSVKGGSSISAALSKYPGDMPPILIQMLQVGEETGELGNILERLARFYRREVNSAVDTLVTLIEPALIVILGLGVGFLLASVLIPIYNVSSSI